MGITDLTNKKPGNEKRDTMSGPISPRKNRTDADTHTTTQPTADAERIQNKNQRNDEKPRLQIPTNHKTEN